MLVWSWHFRVLLPYNFVHSFLYALPKTNGSPRKEWIGIEDESSSRGDPWSRSKNLAPCRFWHAHTTCANCSRFSSQEYTTLWFGSTSFAIWAKTWQQQFEMTVDSGRVQSVTRHSELLIICFPSSGTVAKMDAEAREDPKYKARIHPQSQSHLSLHYTAAGRVSGRALRAEEMVTPLVTESG